MKIRHFKWMPFSIWPRVKKFKDGDFFQETFTFLEPEYDHGNDDQYDWNKLTGVKLNYFRPKKDSLMVGWRWNLETKMVEVCFYKHTNFAWVASEVLFEIPKGGSLKVNIARDTQFFGNRFVVNLIYGSKTETEQLSTTDLGWLINSWFGGNKLPPNKIVFDVH